MAGVGCPIFIGQELDSYTNWNYLNARYESPNIGRFTSEDPIFVQSPESQNIANPQDLNSYTYAGGAVGGALLGTGVGAGEGLALIAQAGGYAGITTALTTDGLDSAVSGLRSFLPLFRIYLFPTPSPKLPTVLLPPPTHTTTMATLPQEGVLSYNKQSRRYERRGS